MPWHALQVRGDFLAGKMALLWSGSAHVTYENTDLQRDYNLVEQAGRLARQAVLPGQESIHKLAEAVGVSYQMQLQEGMQKLPGHGELGKKYCGGGWGGYALYLFESEEQRAAFLKLEGSKAIEPYIHC
jgi:mevalonate kinase